MYASTSIQNTKRLKLDDINLSKVEVNVSSLPSKIGWEFLTQVRHDVLSIVESILQGFIFRIIATHLPVNYQSTLVKVRI